jgi:hypothetical protein
VAELEDLRARLDRLEQHIEQAVAVRHTELVELVQTLHSDAWDAANLRAAGLDELVRQLNTDQVAAAALRHESVEVGFRLAEAQTSALDELLRSLHGDSWDASDARIAKLAELVMAVADQIEQRAAGRHAVLMERLESLAREDAARTKLVVDVLRGASAESKTE